VGLTGNVAGVLTVSNATEATNTTTAALVVTGGIACGGDVYLGDDVFLSSGAVLNWNAGDVTITHSANALAFAGVTGGYTFDDTVGSSDTTAGFEVTGAATAGFKVTGACTAGISIGTCATGIDFTGTYTGNCIDFTDITINHTGSAGPCMIRAGTYGDPATTTFVENADEDQSGMIRLYGATSANGTSYDRGIFVCLVTTGTKGIFPFAGLAEVRGQTGNGPTKVQAAQFICDLHTTDAKLAALGGDATAGMYGGWFKITAIDGATIASGSRAAPIWLDNQLYGANAATIGEEYAIFSTTGGSQPKAWAGFETTSSGWDQLFYFDETMAAAEPFVSTGCSVTVATVPYLKVLVNATQYGIPLIAI